ncbi:type-2 ice-structuring protein-like [Pempheris klunzingeri]|uniref:type-2 ice-structuring protein-like n=1 Tax=Pempheris klunzingeri TaxID=3127111 RepID=UPI0039811E33
MYAATDQAPPDPPCPGGSEFNGRCFTFIPRVLTWANAEKNCHSMKAHLASLHSMEEYQFVQAMIQKATQRFTQAWTGASDCQKHDAWFWSDGSHFEFSLWCDGQPDNVNGEESCQLINHGDNNCWADEACSHLHASVCASDL